MRYIARPETWYKAGTDVELVDDYRPEGMSAGLFRGIRVVKDSDAEGGEPVGTELIDEEICSFDEFDTVEGEMARY